MLIICRPVAFNRLRDGILAMPLSPDKRLDQVTVLDIAGIAVHAIENPDRLVGKRIDLASDSITGKQTAEMLSDILGREIPYQQLPIDQVRRWAGEDIATMFQRFEDNTYFLDITAQPAPHRDRTRRCECGTGHRHPGAQPLRSER